MRLTAPMVPVLALLAYLTASPLALAAGLYLAPRGVRPLARAGAYVAGVADVHALSYNPAGLAWARPQLLVDLALPLHRTVYSRRVYPDSPQLMPVEGRELGLPSPTVGAVLAVPGVGDWLRLGLSLAADTPLMQNWPSAWANPDTPQRYAAGDFRGTALLNASVGLGIAPTDWLALGVGVDLLVGSFAAAATISTCDGALCVQAEDPEYDATIALRAVGLLAPALHLGMILRPLPWLRLGLAYRSMAVVDHEASFHLSLPQAAAYAQAKLQPAAPRAQVHMRLPPIWRAGIEVRNRRARLELTFVHEGWSVHDAIVVRVERAALENIVALGTYPLATQIAIARNYRDISAWRLGGEVRLLGGEVGRQLGLRAGLMWEPSAIAPAVLTPMSVDLDKVLVSAGPYLRLGPWLLEATCAYVHLFSQRVRDSRQLQINPTRPPWPGRTPIGNGDYRSYAWVAGLGARVDL